MKSKKKLWLSMTIVLAVLIAAIGGTYAFFTARRTASQNKFTVGTLDLSVTGDNNVANEPFVVENIGQNGHINGTKTWTIKNTGSLPGRLLVRLDGLTNVEGGCVNDQVKEVEPNCADPAKEGDLGKDLAAKLALDGVDQVNSTLATDQQNKMGDDWNALTPIVLQPNETRTVAMSWDAPETAYGNEIQGDAVKFDMVFRLIQLINGPTPVNH